MMACMRLVVFFLALCAGYAQSTAQSVVSFRVRLGVTDSQPRTWDGKANVEGGRLVSIRLLRAHPEDRLEAPNEWKVATRAGVNFRKRAWEPEPNKGATPYINAPELIVDVEGGSGTRVRFATKNGSFEVRPFELSPGQSPPLLGGAVIADRVVASEKISAPDQQSDFATIAAGPNGELWAGWIALLQGCE